MNILAKAKKLPSGNWRIRASKTVNGTLIRKSFTDVDKKRAEIAAMNWLSEQEDNIGIDNLTLSKCYDRYITAKENVLSPSTIRNYKKLHENHLQDIMDKKVNALTSEQIQRSINIYAANHSPKSVRNCFGLLSAVLKMFRPNLQLNITLPQKEKKEIKVPTDEDIKTYLKISKNTNCYKPILLAAFGGLREGEICALEKDDIGETYVDVNKSMVCDSEGKWHIKPPKTYSSNRRAELPKFVIDEIKNCEDKVVVYNPHSLSMAFNKLLKRHNLPPCRFHDLRHYYVSSLHALNIPDKYIMQQGGWATNYTMQNVYNHTMKDKQSEFADKITTHFENLSNNNKSTEP